MKMIAGALMLGLTLASREFTRRSRKPFSE